MFIIIGFPIVLLAIVGIRYFLYEILIPSLLTSRATPSTEEEKKGTSNEQH